MISTKMTDSKIAFIHIPKNAGTYVNEAVEGIEFIRGRFVGNRNEKCYCGGYYGQEHEGKTNIPANRVEEDFKDTIVFSSFRNPWDWIISWNYEVQARFFWKDFSSIEERTKYVLNTSYDELKWPGQRLIYFGLWSTSGRFMPDYMLRLEDFDNQLKQFADLFGLEVKPIPRRQVADGKVGYRKYYSDNLAELVYQTYKREIDLFGYDFDKGYIGGVFGNSIEVSKEVKNKVKYYFEEDKLEVLND